MKQRPNNAPHGFAWIERAEEWSTHGSTIEIRVVTSSGESARVTVRPIMPGVWNYQFIPPNTSMPIASPMLLPASPSHQALAVEECAGEIVIADSLIRVHISRAPWGIAFRDSHGRILFRENPTDIDGLGRPFVLPLGFTRSDGRTQHVTQSFHLAPDEHLFGLGEKFTPLDKRGQRITGWTVDALGSTSERSHKNVPFLISTRGYGLFFDTGARIQWDLGTTSVQSYTVMVDAPKFSAYVIRGTTPAEILRRYADLTGHAPLPPRWTFGLWSSSGGTYRDRSRMEQLVEEIDRYEFPADVVHIDPWWMKWRTYCDFRWDHTAFPNPQEFIDHLHQRGLKLCLWEHPYISIESDLYRHGREKGYFVRKAGGDVYVIQYGLSLAPRPDGVVREATPENSWNAPVAIIDFTYAEAREWFKDLHRPILAMGVDVFKTDFGEDIPADAVFHNGETGATMHNLYPLLYNQTVFALTREVKGSGIVWSRSGTAGSQRYPVCWSGDPAADFDSLACTIRGGLSAGMSGIPFWSNDIGGYRGTPTPELFIRWAQFGLLCSHSRMHGDSPREPWAFGDEATYIVRQFVHLRYRLFPYLYSCAFEAHTAGLPVMRAMPLAFPHDPNTYDKDLQYMLGPHLLVAPIYNAEGTRTVYLPEGTWTDFWNDDVYQGAENRLFTVPLDRIPLFLRKGAILPMMRPSFRIPEGRVDPLVVRVSPDIRCSYTLHENDSETLFACDLQGNGIVFSWSGTSLRSLEIEVLLPPGVKMIAPARECAHLLENQPVLLPGRRMVVMQTVPTQEGVLRFTTVG